jgi:phage gp36-like protein
MALESVQLYCSQADLEGLLSFNGVKLWADDDGDEEIDAVEQDAIDFALGDAAVTIDQYLSTLHTPTWLATSRWVNNRATWLSAYALCGRRGNTVPESLENRALEIQEELAYHRDSSRPIAGIPVRMAMVPTFSNVRVDVRYSFKVLRVDRTTSSRHRASSLEQFTDWNSAFRFEW